jgi:SAM-dependent methyltransferase
MAASPALLPIIAPFDAVAETYDEVFTNSLIGRAQRNSVWRELDRCFGSGQRILELNCGTGVDAIHLAERGVETLACDAAPRMIEVACRRLRAAKVLAKVGFRVLATENISRLEDEGPFDGALSNFAGLNCVENLRNVARHLASLLRPGGRFVACMAGRFVGWEVIWYLSHGNVRKALRRFHPEGATARLADGVTLRVHYPSVGDMARMFAPEFKLRRWKGVGVVVPPSYLEHLAQRYPAALKALAKADRWLGRVPLARSMADHKLLEFERLKP